ncbi:type II toxin-antitoxin system YafQ family toxin [Rhodopseudomonas palustris]|uniref:type II toxin-antitoxin system YafQ family toxin n=1 Tax=Rhodopseudomonas palustris TaxID=1076 RepID=UPI002ACD8CBA|nr:type II toxin-antitoxin system YafQ family toxin [Rhodopseudomonas palustris]WQG97936.1 type II toxin-antitoxin system YafQ family toxin [Rhodopseudomonas palustris]
MRSLRLSTAFKRDLKRINRRGYVTARLDRVVDALLSGVPLPPACRPHALKGTWTGYLECHIGPDWLLIYRLTPEEVLLARTGTHSDLFDE